MHFLIQLFRNLKKKIENNGKGRDKYSPGSAREPAEFCWCNVCDAILCSVFCSQNQLINASTNKEPRILSQITFAASLVCPTSSASSQGIKSPEHFVRAVERYQIIFRESYHHGLIISSNNCFLCDQWESDYWYYRYVMLCVKRRVIMRSWPLFYCSDGIYLWMHRNHY